MINVICLKHGIKYASIYVNNLKKMVQRHLTLDHKFYCFTDDEKDIDAGIEIKKLPALPYEGWWWKPYVFNNEHDYQGNINLFLDLDMVLIGNINKLFDHDIEKFYGLEDPGRIWGRHNRLGSAVMRWPKGQYSDIWHKFNKEAVRKYRGDQDWVYSLYKDQINFYPTKWIMSYKWEVRSREELNGFGKQSSFKTVKDVSTDPETCILAFHGYPQPHQVKDPIIVNNWC
jgi:hypothetical protein